jgi:hypothetical protein
MSERVLVRPAVSARGRVSARARSHLFVRLGPLLVVCFAALLRVGPVGVHDWPLGDGGLFYQMVGELVAHGLRLPATTGYDGAAIPFAYPPLALYLAAVLEMTTPLSRADLFRLLPAAFSLLEVPAVYLLAQEVLPSRRHAAIAALAFAAVPFAFQWHFTGGGLSRSLGMLLAILAVSSGLRLLGDGSRRHLIPTTLLAAGAGLSHPEGAVFVVVGLAVALVTGPRHHVRRLALAALASVAVAAPWWLTILAAHGPGPFVIALGGTSHDPVAAAVTWAFAYLVAAPLPVVGGLAILGQVSEALGRRLLLPLWWLAICVLDSRYAPVSGAVPMSLLAAVGLVDVLEPGVRSLAARMVPRIASAPLAAGATLAAIGLIVVSGILGDARWFGPGAALTQADRSAMAWAGNHLPNRRFVVLGGPDWGSDDVAEWFPALSGRVSLTTSQGLEWVDPPVRSTEAAAETQLRACQPRPAGCLDAWLARHAGPSADWALYVADDGSARALTGTDCCAAARAWIRANAGLQVVYSEAGALIAIPRSASATRVTGS